MPEFIDEVLRGLTTGAIDTAIMYAPFAASRFREASGSVSRKLPHSVSPIMRQIGQGAPFFRAVYQHSKADPFKTVRGLYKGAGTYYVTAYSWLVAAEFGVNHIARTKGLNDFYATIMAGIVGGIVATPGESYMVQGKTFKTIFANGMGPAFYSVKGFIPTMIRELTFSIVSVSGVQSYASNKIADVCYHGKANMLTNTFGAIICAPILALTQPTARIAATMQATNLGFFATMQNLDHLGRKQVRSLPNNSSQLKQSLAYLSIAYFPGGALRVGALIGTGLIYGVMGNVFDEETTQKSAAITP